MTSPEKNVDCLSYWLKLEALKDGGCLRFFLLEKADLSLRFLEETFTEFKSINGCFPEKVILSRSAFNYLGLTPSSFDFMETPPVICIEGIGAGSEIQVGSRVIKSGHGDKLGIVTHLHQQQINNLANVRILGKQYTWGHLGDICLLERLTKK